MNRTCKGCNEVKPNVAFSKVYPSYCKECFKLLRRASQQDRHLDREWVRDWLKRYFEMKQQAEM